MPLQFFPFLNSQKIQLSALCAIQFSNLPAPAQAYSQASLSGIFPVLKENKSDLPTSFQPGYPIYVDRSLRGRQFQFNIPVRNIFFGEP